MKHIQFFTRLLIVAAWAVLAGVAYSASFMVGVNFFSLGWPTYLFFAVLAMAVIYALTYFTKYFWSIDE